MSAVCWWGWARASDTRHQLGWAEAFCEQNCFMMLDESEGGLSEWRSA